MFTGIERTLEFDITEEQYLALAAGKHIQDCMSNLSDSEREFIMTGVTEDEWNDVFGVEE